MRCNSSYSSRFKLGFRPTYVQSTVCSCELRLGRGGEGERWWWRRGCWTLRGGDVVLKDCGEGAAASVNTTDRPTDAGAWRILIDISSKSSCVELQLAYTYS